MARLSHWLRAGQRACARGLGALCFAVLALLAVTPAVARADGMGNPAACTVAAIPDVGGADTFIHPPPMGGFSFECVVQNAYWGGPNGGDGLIKNLVLNSMGLATSIMWAAVILELAFVGLFAKEPAAEFIKAMSWMLGVTVLLQFYPVNLVNLFSGFAIEGARTAQGFVHDASGKIPDPAALAAAGGAKEQAAAIAAQYVALDKKPSRTADEERALTQLRDFVDPNRCKAQVQDASRTNATQTTVAALQSTCDEIQRQVATTRTEYEGALGKLQQTWIAAKDFVDSYTPASMIRGMAVRIAGVVMEWFLAGLMVAVGVIAGMAFCLQLAIGHLCIACMGFRHGRKVGSWWFKTTFATAALPVILSAVVGLYQGSIDSLVRQAGDSPIVTLIGYIALVPTMILAAKGGYGLLQQFGGGALAAGGEVAGMMAKGAVTAATGGAAAFAANRANGMGRLASAASAAGSTMRDGAIGKMADLSGGLLGGGDKDRTAAVKSFTAHSGDKVARMTANAARGVASRVGMGGGAPSARAGSAQASAQRTEAGSGYYAPTGRVSDGEREFAEQMAAADLGAELTADDFGTTPGGQVQLSDRGRAKVDAYRQRHGKAMRSTARMDASAFVNQPRVQAALATGHVPSAFDGTSLEGQFDQDTDMMPGTPLRAIAEALPASVTALRGPTDTGRDAAARTKAVAQAIYKRSGGNWSSATSASAQLASLAARTAPADWPTASSGAPVGLQPDSVNFGPERDRQYASQEGSPFSAALAMGASPERAYHTAFSQGRQAVADLDFGGDDSRRDAAAHAHAFLHPTAAAPIAQSYARGGSRASSGTSSGTSSSTSSSASGRGPAMRGPSASGPTVSGPTVSGPTVSGPTVSGPTVSGPSVSAPAAASVPLTARQGV